jgi:hypothetical protein
MMFLSCQTGQKFLKSRNVRAGSADPGALLWRGDSLSRLNLLQRI